MSTLAAREFLCRRCLLRARKLSSSTPSKTRSLSTAGYSQLRSRRLLAVYGHDAAHFLQGLTTANIPTSGLLSSPSNPQALYSAFMNAQGRLLHDTFIYPIHPQHALRASISNGSESTASSVFAVEVDANQVSRLQAFLKKYKLRAKVNIRQIEEEELAVFGAWSRAGSDTKLAHASVLNRDNSSLLVALDPRIPEPWHRIIVPTSHTATIPELTGLAASPEEAYTVQRYLHGIPEGQQELPREETLLHEANIDLMHGVDFRKGCYVGQELVIRTQHTGVVRKRIMPVQIWVQTPPPAEALEQSNPVFGDGTERGSGKDGHSSTEIEEALKPLVGQSMKSKGAKRPDGKLLGTIGNIGLALCRLERVIETEDSVAKGRTKMLQLDLPSESKLENAWLRPFVPEWWEERGKIMQGGFESLKVRAPGGNS